FLKKKFDFASVKTASTPIETHKPLTKDEEAADVNVHLYRSMIGSLIYLTASRPDIMFAVCACSRFQVTLKTLHLYAVKRIFRYLKGKPKLDLWYPKVSSFDLEAYLDSDYAGANLDKKSTTGGSTDPKHLGPTSGIRATRRTLSKKNNKNNKHSLSRSRKMSHPADEFSQHLSDDDVSNHEDASDNGDATNKPKQQLISSATTILNIKLPILKKEEYDIWAMEMEHYLEYIDNDVWKVIQNGNSKKRISTGKDGVIRVLPPVSAAEIHAVEKERKARTILLMAIPKEI
ncbi:hypothetical protein Tco_1194000, partial [Tanacetum coccineum]